MTRSSLRVFLRRADEVLRRGMDITFALMGIILLFPLFVLISLAVKKSSPGPIFYWGPRAGKNNKTFRILKFRTMYERKESYQGPKVTAEHDPRITPLGRMLRQTKLNELPQFWNVLVGEMSLVGPRPEDPSIAAEWPAEVRKEILSVKPGITSPASVVYRNEEEMLQSQNLMDNYLWDILPTKLRLDQLYVRNRSVLTDLDILFWTTLALVPRLKNYAVPQHLLFWGPLARFTHRFLTWFFIDFVVAFFSVALAGVIRRLNSPLDLGWQLAVLIALAIALLFSLINSLAGVNNINWSRARPQDVLDLAISSGIVTSILFVFNLFFTENNTLPASMILMTALFAFLGFVGVRYRTRLFTYLFNRWDRLRPRSLNNLGERVLIVGAGEVGRFATWLMRNETLEKAFTIVGMVDDDPRKIGTKVDGCVVIGTTDNVAQLVKKRDIGLILFAIADIDPADQERILISCQNSKARIIPIPDIIENLKAHFPKNETDQDEVFNKVLNNAITDRLTNAYNRLHFLRLAQAEMMRSQRYGHEMAVVMVCVDYKRPASARFSEAVASRLVQHAARKCLENIRGIDILGRYRGNTLVALLPETGECEARLVAERLEQAVVKDSIHTHQGDMQPTVRVKVATDFTKYYDKGIEILLSQMQAQLINEASQPVESVS